MGLDVTLATARIKISRWRVAVMVEIGSCRESDAVFGVSILLLFSLGLWVRHFEVKSKVDVVSV
jgi:hypothetical protein